MNYKDYSFEDLDHQLMDYNAVLGSNGIYITIEEYIQYYVVEPMLAEVLKIFS